MSHDPSADEAEIRRMIAAWSRAVEAKNLDGILADYSPDIVVYDAIPPYKLVGPQAVRAAWEGCLPYFPERFRSEHRDLKVLVSGDTAMVFGLHHFVPEPADHPCGHTWMRVTAGYQRIDGRWRVVHEHVSIPFNPMSNEAWYLRDPDVLDRPDYSASSTPCGGAP